MLLVIGQEFWASFCLIPALFTHLQFTHIYNEKETETPSTVFYSWTKFKCSQEHLAHS